MPRAYYTCFKFEGHHPKDLHCTHKYLGKIDGDTAKKVIDEIENYFSNKNIRPFKILFNKEDFFGPENDIRVLRTEESPLLFFINLKHTLDQYKEENHKIYRPHVTTSEFDEIDSPIVSYVLMKGDKIFKEWKFEGSNKPI